MGGTNPYIPESKATGPKKRFKLTVQNSGQTFDLDPAQGLPSSETGLPGSVLDVALALGVNIDHACGGVVACSTCHIFVKKGFNSCSELTEAEEDQLEKAPGLQTTSRLACQCVPTGNEDITIEIPNWNRNAVREGA